jgi:CBS domain-containing protein
MTSLDQSVSELMQHEVVTLQQSDRLDLADDIMSLGRIRHLPVLEDEQLVGMLSNRDLLAASLSKALDFEAKHRRAFMRAVEVTEVMTQDVDTVRPDDRADDAGRRMLQRKIGCLPVVDEQGAFLGLLTETDLLKAALGLGPDADVTDVAPAPADAGRYEEELQQLRRVRDELRVQVHLGKAEAVELWERLEHRFAEAEARAKALARQAEAPVQDVADAVRLLIDEIRTGYRTLRDLL